MSHSSLQTRWDAGSAAFGGGAMLGEASVRTLAASGYDFVLLDCQHGPYDEGRAAEIIRGLPGAPCAFIVRVSCADATLIGRVLDAGADGIVVPLVSTPEQAATAAGACRYPPARVRSFGPNRPDLGLDLQALEERVSCFVMIETREALDNLDAILATPGITGVMVGPIDLGIALGVAPADAVGSDAVRSALVSIVEACRRHEVVPGIFGFNRVHAAGLVELGFRFMTVGADALSIRDGAAADLAALRGDSQDSAERSTRG